MHTYLFVSFIVLTSIAPNYTQRFNRQKGQSQYCVTPDNYYGSCTTLSYCPQVANIFAEVDQQYAQQYLFALQRACGTRSVQGDPVVCCARQQVASEPPKPSADNPFLNNNRRTTIPPQIQPEPPTPPSTTQLPQTSAPLIDNKASYCRGPDTKHGVCAALEKCSPLLSRLQNNQRDETFKNFLRASNRICGGLGSNVCCPTSESTDIPVTSKPTINTNSESGSLINSNEIPRSFPTVAEGCGIASNSYRRIVGGKVSKKGSWPWVALLGYDDGVSTAFRCGGALVTARHIVTAAHCIVRGLTVVRLGEHDLSTDTETQHEDIPIAKSVVHPSYNRNTGHSDIAVLYLQRNVQFSATIKPICMPITPEQRSKSNVGYSPFVVGWGKTMEGGFSSEVLQELQIPVYENSVCESAYKKAKRFFAANQFDSAVLCAGVLSGGKDTCQGDSGGPLMIPDQYTNFVRFSLIGVVSYGIGCARPEIPGVYSNVAYHMDWLTQQIENTP